MGVKTKMETKRERLIHKLRDEIKTGKFSNCKKLPAERLLAEQLGVTRALLREALLTMEGMGQINISGRDGIYILQNGLEGVTHSINTLSLWPSVMNNDILEVRVILEVPAAEIAAKNRTDDDLERMEECLRILAGLDKNNEADYAEGNRWDCMLHETIMRSTKNELLIRIYEGLLSLMRDFTERHRTMLFNKIPGWAGRAFQEHERLVSAIRERTPKTAGETMRVHLCRALKGRGFLDGDNAPFEEFACCDEAVDISIP